MIDTEVEQADVDGLVRDLEAMQAVLNRDRTALRPQLEAMIFRADRMRHQAAGGRFEKSLAAAYDMLLKLQGGAVRECPERMVAEAEPARSAASWSNRWLFRRDVAA